MRNFIILFKDNEGTSVLVRILDYFDKVSILRPIDGYGWEPFDRHSCGPISTADLLRCMERIYSPKKVSMDEINSIYSKTARSPLIDFDRATSVGFKMRFGPNTYPAMILSRVPSIADILKGNFRQSNYAGYKLRLLELFKKYDIVVFFAVREDLFRWALSLYRGDGTGRKGHVQFNIWSGFLKKEALPKIWVNEKRLKKIITKCKSIIDGKVDLMAQMHSMGIRTAPLYYEHFCTDKYDYFKRFSDFIEADISEQDVKSALAKVSHLVKVHSEDISDFVVNHQEIENQFGEYRFDFERLCRKAIGSHWNDDFYRFTTAHN